jgi:hypothetical protein
MVEQHPPHTRRDNAKNNRRTRWDKVLLPLTAIAILLVFIIAMLVIYLLAD